VKISCNEPAAETCSGTVLVLTRNEYQPLPAGPVGRLTVMFAFVKVKGEQIATITNTVSPRVAAALRRGVVPVTISANLRVTGGQTIHATARKALRNRRA
jgi:hypothetical protein